MDELKKSLSLWQLIAFGVAGVVGASWIYTNSKFFAAYGAGGVLVGLAIGCGLAACVAIAYAELTTAFPRAGGEVVFAYTVLGRGAAFIAGWMLLGAYVSSLAFYVTAFGFLLGRLIPAINTIPLYEINGETVYLPVLLIGVALTLIYLALNWFGVKLGAQVQMLLFVGIILVGAALIVVGFGTGSPENFFPAFNADSSALSDALRFVIPAMTFLAGFGLVAVLAEDADLPPKRIGVAVLVTVLGAGSFYLLVLAATAWVHPWQHTAELDLGTISAFTEAGHPTLAMGGYAIAILGLLTSFLGLFVASSRILMAMGRAQLLPSVLAHVHPVHGTPTVALLSTTIVTLALGWLGPGAVVWFLDTGGVYLGVVWLMVVWAKYALPRKYPQMQRPYVSALTWLPAVGAIGAILIVVWALAPGTPASLVWPAEYIILGVWLLLGGALYVGSSKLEDHHALTAMLGDSYHQLHRRTTGTTRDHG
ncbi:putative amino acid permease YhdG [Corynebacterium ciconiae DSM 44920]|uniref:APC family permease n=1 Tax=Corynebacterium ciconiae TaxID=227319 RepID=UPI00035D6E2E|nr:APC family permease [Corynebacterium ciconiae]WKD61287.1 putative amino acid permease YhdG [Corynebacterium ciconiae DSM 44920]